MNHIIYIERVNQHISLFIELIIFFLKKQDELEIVFFNLKLRNFFCLKKLLEGKIKAMPGLNYHFYIKNRTDVDILKKFMEKRKSVLEWLILSKGKNTLAFNMVNIDYPIIESISIDDTDELKTLLDAFVDAKVIDGYEVDIETN